MDRRKIRKCAMCIIFESEFANDEEFFALQSFADEIAMDFSEKDNQEVLELSSGCIEKKTELDKLIEDNLKDWTLPRISKTDLSILRLAFYEMVYLNLPYKVCINEAVELSKIYSADKSPSFINGVLGAYVNNK